jgi:hypothetical protein
MKLLLTDFDASVSAALCGNGCSFSTIDIG